MTPDILYKYLILRKIFRMKTKPQEFSAFTAIGVLIAISPFVKITFGPAEIDNEQTIALIGIFVAIVTFLITQSRSAQQSKRQHTIETMLALRNTEEFRRDLKLRARHFAPGEAIDPEKLEFYSEQSSSPHENKRAQHDSAMATYSLLNHWETVAILVREDALDEAILKASMRSICTNFLYDCRKVIVKMNRKDPRMYEGLVWLFNRWKEDSRDLNQS
ncbi:hypothetical protein ATO10_10330 [Actibacterium atlanticum]|uniref:DUF4760 domain-containing protein n=1 Tax=Actibacterium atlanticum TaxID=1461693 RepID=A0A058ZKL5_9RHOB|nr:DUF4760 domain-containing protein [Actibacterium atlanticum]KCV81735.1 hypothetical protein ATO10_10330 [Actibacterium atlanticum]